MNKESTNKKTQKAVEKAAETMNVLDAAGVAIVILRSNSEADNRRVVDLYAHKNLTPLIKTANKTSNSVKKYPQNIYVVNPLGMVQEFGEPFSWESHGLPSSDSSPHSSNNSLMKKLSECCNSDANSQAHKLIYIPDSKILEGPDGCMYIYLLKNIARLKRQGKSNDRQEKYNEHNNIPKGRVNTLVVISCTDGALSKELGRDAHILDVPYPDTEEILDIIDSAEESCSIGNPGLLPTEKKVLAEIMRGLREDDIRSIFNMAYAEHETPTKKNLHKSAEKEKIQLIEGVQGLTWEKVGTPELGGLKTLIKYIKGKTEIYLHPAAAKAKLANPPKGILLCGLPGTGKTTLARFIAWLLGIPLLKLNISDLKDQWVGNTEKNCDIALRAIESVSPCVVLIDEIEKVLSGTDAGGGAHETTKSMFSKILDWMQREKDKPIFTIATANKTAELPSELRRKGRFDETFFVGVTTRKDCEETFKIHLDRKKNVFKYSEDARNEIIDAVMNEAARLSRFLNGADIETIVKDAFANLFTQAVKKLSKDDLKQLDDKPEKIIKPYTQDEVKEALIAELNRTRSYFDSNMETTAYYWLDMYTQQFIDANDDPESNGRGVILPIEKDCFNKETLMFDINLLQKKKLLSKEVENPKKANETSEEYKNFLDEQLKAAESYDEKLRWQLAKQIFEFNQNSQRRR